MIRLLLVSVALALPATAKELPPVPKDGKVQVEQAKQWIDAGVQLVDVRTPAEWDEGVIEGARRINWKDEDFEKQARDQLDPKRPVLVYCRSGRRSASAAEALRKMGFEPVMNLEGGMIAWGQADESKVLVQ